MKKSNTETVPLNYIEREKVETVRGKMKTDRFFHELAETFRAMSDPTRTKIIYALCLENELCVHDIQV